MGRDEEERGGKDGERERLKFVKQENDEMKDGGKDGG